MSKVRKTWSRDDAIEAHQLDAFFRELKKLSLREYLIAKYIYIFKQNIRTVMACEYVTYVDENEPTKKVLEIKHPWDYEGSDYTTILADRSLYLLESNEYRPQEYGSSPLFIASNGKCVNLQRVYMIFLKASENAGIPKVTAVNILATSHVLEGK